MTSWDKESQSCPRAFVIPSPLRCLRPKGLARPAPPTRSHGVLQTYLDIHRNCRSTLSTNATIKENKTVTPGHAVLDPHRCLRRLSHNSSAAPVPATNSTRWNTSTTLPTVLNTSNQLRTSGGTHRTHLRTPTPMCELSSWGATATCSRTSSPPVCRHRGRWTTRSNSRLDQLPRVAPSSA